MNAELGAVALHRQRVEPGRPDRRALLLVDEILATTLHVRHHPRIVREHPEEVQVNPHLEPRRTRRRQEVALELAVRRLDGPPISVVVAQRSRLVHVHVEVRDEAVPPPILVVLFVVLVEKRVQRLLRVIPGEILRRRLEEIQQRLLGVVRRRMLLLPKLCLPARKQRVRRTVRVRLVLIHRIPGMDAEVVLEVAHDRTHPVSRHLDDEVDVALFQHVRHAPGRELTVGEDTADVEPPRLDGIKETL